MHKNWKKFCHIIIYAKNITFNEQGYPSYDLYRYNEEELFAYLKLQDNSTIELPLKEYLLGVLATNAIIGLDIEVIKAVCILYRTYAFDMMKKNKITHLLYFSSMTIIHQNTINVNIFSIFFLDFIDPFITMCYIIITTGGYYG